jgi:AcrR family transcriptional regulator
MLDAAEALFAKDGYHGTSMRDVAEAAECRIALVTYHFGTKDVLFNKVVERRASYMAHQRMQALDAARARAVDAPVELRDLVAGYVWPFVERSSNGGQGWKNYALLVTRLANSPDWAKVISDHYDAVARQFLAEFRRTLPAVSDEDVYHAFSFMVGSMLALVAEPRRVETFPSASTSPTNLSTYLTRCSPSSWVDSRRWTRNEFAKAVAQDL